ncbi:hypothetical protein ACA910_015944 [Epithemia clementina (nom. ined.)]
MASKNNVAVASLIWGVSRCNQVWWYGLNISESDPNSLMQLFDLPPDLFQPLMEEIGWTRRTKSSTNFQELNIHRFLQQFGLSTITKTSRIKYKGHNKCLFLKIGTPKEHHGIGELKPSAMLQNSSCLTISEDLRKLQQTLCTSVVESLQASSSTVDCSTDLQHNNQEAFARSQGKNPIQQQQTESQPQVFPPPPVMCWHNKLVGSPTNIKISNSQTLQQCNYWFKTVIKQTLLPLIFRKEYSSSDSFWLHPNKFGDIAGAITQIAAMYLGTKDKQMSESLGYCAMSPQVRPPNLPLMTKYNLDPNNP